MSQCERRGSVKEARTRRIEGEAVSGGHLVVVVGGTWTRVKAAGAMRGRERFVSGSEGRRTGECYRAMMRGGESFTSAHAIR